MCVRSSISSVTPSHPRGLSRAVRCRYYIQTPMRKIKTTYIGLGPTKSMASFTAAEMSLMESQVPFWVRIQKPIHIFHFIVFPTNSLPPPPLPHLPGSVRLAEFFISFRQFSTSCVGCLLAGPDISRGTTSQQEIFVEVTGQAVDMGMKRTNEPKIRNETETSLKKKEIKKEGKKNNGTNERTNERSNERTNERTSIGETWKRRGVK